MPEEKALTDRPTALRLPGGGGGGEKLVLPCEYPAVARGTPPEDTSVNARTCTATDGWRGGGEGADTTRTERAAPAGPHARHTPHRHLRVEPLLRLQVEPLGGARLQVHSAQVNVFLRGNEQRGHTTIGAATPICI